MADSEVIDIASSSSEEETEAKLCQKAETESNKFVGLCRNPSGQTTLRFQNKPKRSGAQKLKRKSHEGQVNISIKGQKAMVNILVQDSGNTRSSEVVEMKPNCGDEEPVTKKAKPSPTRIPIVKLEKLSEKAINELSLQADTGHMNADSIFDQVLVSLKKPLPDGEHALVVKKLIKKKNKIAVKDESYVKCLSTLLKQTQSQPDKVYIHLKEALDQLSLLATTPTPSSAPPTPVAPKASSAHISRLEKALKTCNEAIKKLEEAEVDLDDDDSTYIKLSRYRRKCIQIYEKLAELKNLSKCLDRKRDKRFRFSGSRYPDVNVRIEKFVNSRKAKNLEFMPDYADVIALVRKVSDDKDLNLGPALIEAEAKQTFESLVTKLKGQRCHDDDDCLASYLPEGGAASVDPAAGDPEVEKALNESKKLAIEKENEIFNSYEKMQELKGQDSTTDFESDKDDSND